MELKVPILKKLYIYSAIYILMVKFLSNFLSLSFCNLQIDLFSNRLDKNQDSSISNVCRIDSWKFANLCIARNAE